MLDDKVKILQEELTQNLSHQFNKMKEDTKPPEIIRPAVSQEIGCSYCKRKPLLGILYIIHDDLNLDELDRNVH